MRHAPFIALVFSVLASGCFAPLEVDHGPAEGMVLAAGTVGDDAASDPDTLDAIVSGAESRSTDDEAFRCAGGVISASAADEVIELTRTGPDEDIYTTYDRIDRIAGIFEECGDPWGMFPTAYRHITARGVSAVEGGEFRNPAWARRIIVDFAGRYLLNLRLALTGDAPSWAWAHYYMLADKPDVSRTRAVLVAMVAHLTLDLPHSLVAIGTTEDDREDFFVFGEMMIEVADDFILELDEVYEADTHDILNGFFFGRWVDGAFGSDATITLSYQTIRTKSWNNRWLLEQSWGGWVADTEIYTAFWAIDGVLATLDAAGTI